MLVQQVQQDHLEAQGQQVVQGLQVHQVKMVVHSFIRKALHRRYGENHGMGVQAAAVTVFDQDYKLIYPETLQLVSTGIIKVTFPEPRQGFVSVTFGQSSSGSAGSAGSTGSTGSTGSAGSTGSTGSAGSTGSTGSTGSAGSTGSSGTSGRDSGTFQHTQTTPSRRWAVNHNLNMRPIVFSATTFLIKSLILKQFLMLMIITHF